MSRFYFQIWIFWALRVLAFTLGFSLLFALLITLFLYMRQGMPDFSVEIKGAIEELFSFWFVVSLNFTLLLALFLSIKPIFNRCANGYKFMLAQCEKQHSFIENVGYGDLLKVWRKWFMLLIWIIAAIMILSLGFTYLLSASTSLFSWFGFKVLFLYVLIAGYPSFVILAARCKKIRVRKC